MKYTYCLLAVACLLHILPISAVNNLDNNNNINALNLGKNKDKDDYEYGVVIDLGTSGSRCSIFSWPTDSEYPYADVAFAPFDDPENPYYDNIAPGIATFQDNPVAAGPYLKPLFDFVVDKVPEKKIQTTPVFIKGTAGLRSLGPVCQKILDSVFDYASENYSFLINQSFIGTVSGLEEGAYGWISANKLLGNFDNPNSGGKSTTMGTLDMGHGSTQITFVPQVNVSTIPYDYLFNFSYKNETFAVYTHSFSGFGKTQALYAANATAILGQNSSEYMNPCMLEGYTYNITDDAGNQYEVVGGGDWIKCKSITYDILNKTAPCPYKPCSFDGAYQPPLVGEFWTISNFIDIAEFFGHEKEVTPEDIFASVGKYCTMTWDEALKKYSDEDQEELATYCFGGNYFASLLGNGYGFPADFEIHIHNRINNYHISWALGEMIVELQRGW